MKARCFAATVLLAFVFCLVSVDFAYAQWSAINSGYAVTTNWHGIDIPYGQTVVATAGTKDPDVIKVEFIWRDPDENVIWDENVSVLGPLVTPNVPSNVPQEVIEWATDNPGVTYWYAQSAHFPEILGDWGVQAIFHNATKPKGRSEVDFVIRASSFNVIPDIPVLGTAGATIAMLLGLGFFYKRKKQP